MIASRRKERKKKKKKKYTLDNVLYKLKIFLTYL